MTRGRTQHVTLHGYSPANVHDYLIRPGRSPQISVDFAVSLLAAASACSASCEMLYTVLRPSRTLYRCPRALSATQPDPTAESVYATSKYCSKVTNTVNTVTGQNHDQICREHCLACRTVPHRAVLYVNQVAATLRNRSRAVSELCNSKYGTTVP